MEALQGRDADSVGTERPSRFRPRTHVPENEIAELRDVEFPLAMRGYDRTAVDGYVSRVNRLLAELQITAAPEAAIRHALDEVTEETRGILEQAHRTADDITHRSRAQADDRLQRAEVESADLRAAADAYAKEVRDAVAGQVQALEQDSARIWEERAAVIADLRALAQRLGEAAAAADERLAAQPPLRVPAAPAAPAAEVAEAPRPADETEELTETPLDDEL